MQEYADIRRQLEDDGYGLTDKEYGYNISYARRKAKACGKGEDYIQILLPDVIKEYIFRRCINMVSMTVKAVSE